MKRLTEPTLWITGFLFLPLVLLAALYLTGCPGGPGPVLTYSIAGQVTVPYYDVDGPAPAGLVGVTVTAGTASDVTDAQGNYSIGSLPAGDYTVTPSGPSGEFAGGIAYDYVFTPENRALTLSSNQGNVDFVADSPSHPAQFVGLWYRADFPWYMDFRTDGTYSAGPTSPPNERQGTWKVSGDVVYVTEEGVPEQSYPYSFSSPTLLQLTMDEPVTFTKQQ